MITILRKNQRVLMLVVAFLTIIAFIWLYNPADTYYLGRGAVANIYGRKVSQADIERQVKTYQLALAMGQFSLLESLGGMTQDENQALEEFIWNLFVLHHQAEKLGVKPTDSQIADRIKAVRTFQTGGQFDPSRYKAFVLEQLGPPVSPSFSSKMSFETLCASNAFEKLSPLRPPSAIWIFVTPPGYSRN